MGALARPFFKGSTIRRLNVPQSFRVYLEEMDEGAGFLNFVLTAVKVSNAGAPNPMDGGRTARNVRDL